MYMYVEKHNVRFVCVYVCTKKSMYLGIYTIHVVLNHTAYRACTSYRYVNVTRCTAVYTCTYAAICINTYPSDVLLVPLVEVDDPVAEALECGGCQGPPDGGELTVVERLGHLVQLCTHTHLSS